MLLSFQTGFNLVNAAVVCAILESISDLEPSSVLTELRYLKLVRYFISENAKNHVSFMARKLILTKVTHQIQTKDRHVDETVATDYSSLPSQLQSVSVV